MGTRFIALRRNIESDTTTTSRLKIRWGEEEREVKKREKVGRGAERRICET